MKKISKVLCSLALFCICIITAGASNETLCYVIDQQGCEIDSYYADQEDKYYLFLTSKEEVDSLTVHVDASITNTSVGQLDNDTHILTNAFQDTGDSVVLTDNTGKTYTVTVMKSEIPSLYITLNDVTLDEIHADKDIKYSGNTVNIVDPSGENKALEAKKVEIKGRGNSSWTLFDKKGYQIKFDKKTSVLGMPKAKKWVLLANASDDSMLRNKIAYDWGNSMSEILAPAAKFVGLWIDGEYRGVYLISEKVEIGSDRVNLDNELGGIFEQDNAFYRDEQYWFKDELSGNYYTLKDAVDEGNCESTLDNFKAKLNGFEQYLFFTSPEDVTLDELSKYIDVDSFAAYYIINEYLLNRESVTTSFYWYCNGSDDVIHLGPVWDFDTCMGNDIKEDSTATYHAYTHPVFKTLLNCSTFQEYTKQIWNRQNDKVLEIADGCVQWENYLQCDATMNYIRWDVLGKENSKVDVSFASTYETAVSTLKTWLEKRYELFDIGFFNEINAIVNEENYYVDIKISDHMAPTKELWIAVWSDVNDQDDLKWYKATLKDEVYQCRINMDTLQDLGRYRVNVYTGEYEPTVMVGGTLFYIFRLPTPILNVHHEDGSRYAQIELSGFSNVDNIWFPTWSDENGQDDIQWYQAEKEAKGDWVYNVDLSKHASKGNFTIHAYTGNNKPEKLIANTTFYVDHVVFPQLTATVDSNNQTMLLQLQADIQSYKNVWFPTWSDENGQDDIQWYQATRDADGGWSYTVDLTNHHSSGNFTVHAYAGNEHPEKIVGYTSAYVEKKIEPAVSVKVSDDCTTMDITFRTDKQYSSIWFPTWSIANGQDDIRWYQAAYKNGVWEYSVDLSKHIDIGTYIVHVYTSDNGHMTLLADGSAVVSKHADTHPSVTTVLRGSQLQITLKNASEYENVWFPTWSIDNGQDDIVWYVANKDAKGNWVANVDLTQHHSIGKFFVHVYGSRNTGLMLLTNTEIAYDGV